MIDKDFVISKINSQKTNKEKIATAKSCSREIISFLKKNPRCHNYEDLKSFVTSIIEHIEQHKDSEKIPNITINKNKAKKVNVKSKNAESAAFQPSPIPDVEIVGLKSVKKALLDSIKLSIEHPELFLGNRKPARLILLYGPPGTGKTAVIQSLSKLNIPIYNVSASDIFSKYQGDSEKQIKELFTTAKKNKPCVIFMDEIDFLCKSRDSSENEASNRVKSEFLIQTSTLEHENDIFLVGATNHPWDIDTAFLRRFQKRIYVGLPDFDARKQLLKHFLGKNNNEFSDSDFDTMAKKTDFYSSSDIKQLCQRILCATLNDLQESKCFIKFNDKWVVCRTCASGSSCDSDCNEKRTSFLEVKSHVEEPPANMLHFEDSIQKGKSSVKIEDLKIYQAWTSKYGES